MKNCPADQISSNNQTSHSTTVSKTGRTILYHVWVPLNGKQQLILNSLKLITAPSHSDRNQTAASRLTPVGGFWEPGPLRQEEAWALWTSQLLREFQVINIIFFSISTGKSRVKQGMEFNSWLEECDIQKFGSILILHLLVKKENCLLH